MDVEKHSLNCPNCGSNDITLISENVGECHTCGSKFSISESSDRNVYVTNNILTENSEKKLLKNCAVVYVTDTIDFTRRAAIALAETKTSPSDIFEADFRPARTDKEQFLSATYDVDVSYSVAIGYNRAVNETYYNNSTRRYETRTITVADWQPLSGTKKYTTTGVVTLKTSGDGLYQSGRFANIVLNEKMYVPLEEGKIIDAPISPTEDNYLETKRIAEDLAANNTKNSLPGAYTKDYSATLNSKLTGAKVTVVPDNVLPFRYRNSEYEIRGFSCTDNVCAKELPSDDFFYERTVKKPLRTFYIVLAVLYALFIAANTIIGRISAIPQSIRFSIIMPMFVLSVLLPFLYFAIVKINVDKACVSFATEKLNGLTAFLQCRGLMPLSDSERKSVYDINRNHYVSFRDFKFPVLLILEGLATVIYFIYSFMNEF